MSRSARRLQRTIDAKRKQNTGGGVNLLVGKTFTSNTSAVTPLTNITDQNTGTRWISASQDNVTITVDISGVYDINQIKIIWSGDCTKNYNLQFSTTGTDWQTVYTGSTSNNVVETAIITTFTNTRKTRYLRINCIDRWNAGYGNAIWEVEAYGVRDTGYQMGTIINFTASLASTSQVNLSWNYAGDPLSKYTIKRNGAVLTTITNPAIKTYSDTTVAVGNTYTYEIVGAFATNGSPTNTLSAQVSVADPSAEPTWPLRVSDNKRFLVGANGVPFIWQADTAWVLPSRSTRSEVVTFLDKRAAQGFNVIQMVAIPKVEGVGITNSYGDNPMNGNVGSLITTAGNDPNNAGQYDYWDHVDYIIQQAEARGIYVALLPVWGRTMVPDGSVTASNAEGYGYWIGQRYASNKIIWMLGGDVNDLYDDIWANMARGIARGTHNGVENYSDILITYHTGPHVAPYFNASWLDFNTEQSGHCNGRSYERVSVGYGMSPTKPTMDAEPYYEGHPLCWDPNKGYSTPQQIRAAEYTAMFAGAFGFTYGHQAVWQMYAPGREANNAPNGYWYDAINQTAANQMIYLRRLIESRPILSRVPDQSIITTNQGDLWTRIQATRNNDGGYMMIYTSAGNSFSVDMTKLSSDTAQTYWFNPRNGTATNNGVKSATGTMSFSPPSTEDWVLVIDDPSRQYGAPGQ